MWQFCVEIKNYCKHISIALLCLNHWTSVKGGAHMCFIDPGMSNESTKCIWAPAFLLRDHSPREGSGWWGEKEGSLRFPPETQETQTRSELTWDHESPSLTRLANKHPTQDGNGPSVLKCLVARLLIRRKSGGGEQEASLCGPLWALFNLAVCLSVGVRSIWDCQWNTRGACLCSFRLVMTFVVTLCYMCLYRCLVALHWVYLG